MKYRAEFYEYAYQDNYENGEVDQTTSFVLMMEKSFDTIKDAIDYFEKFYPSRLSLEPLGDNVIVRPEPMQFLEKNEGWRNASEEELEDWKAGKIDLWNLEYQMHLYKFEPVSEEEIASFFK